jgi:hypothetical protein
VSISGASPGVLAANFWGHSISSWSGLPLPHAWMGTQCTFYTNMLAAVFTRTDAQGNATIRLLQLPNDPRLGGLTAFSQWGVIEAPQAAPPLTLTGYARFVVGRPPASFYDSIGALSGSPTGVKGIDHFVVLATGLEF